MQQCKLTKEQAGKFLLLKHGLTGDYIFDGKQGIMGFIRQAGCIQFDPIDVCGKNPELVLQSRVKGFTKGMLYELLYEDRKLVDYFDKNLSIFPVEDWKYFTRRRDYYRDRTRSAGKVAEISDDIKSTIRKNGYAASKDIDYNETVDWYWSATTLSRAALETLYFMGELAIHHKQGAIKHYSLAEDCIPLQILAEEDPNETEAEYHAWHVLRRIGAVGLLWNKPSDAWLGIMDMKAAERKEAFDRLISEGKITEIEVDGIKDMLYCRTGDLPLVERVQSEELMPRTELIAPLDNMMWDRKLIKALFGFDYKWEIYTPVDQRKYGYYVLPILTGSSFVGRAEIVADKKAAKLIVKNIWLEGGVKKTVELKKDIKACIKRFAAFNDCRMIDYSISF